MVAPPEVPASRGLHLPDFSCKSERSGRTDKPLIGAVRPGSDAPFLEGVRPMQPAPARATLVGPPQGVYGAI